MSLRITKVSDYTKSNKNKSQDREKCSIHSSESNKIEEFDKPRVGYLVDSKLNIIEQSEETVNVSHGYSQYDETFTLKKNYQTVNKFEDLLLTYIETKSNPSPILYKKRFLVDFNNKNSNNLPVPDTKQDKNDTKNTVKYIPLERVNITNDVSSYQNELKVNIKTEEKSKYNEPFKLFGIKKYEINNLSKDENKRDKSPVQSYKKQDSESTSLKDQLSKPKPENETTAVTQPPPAPPISTNLPQILIASSINNKNGLENKPASQTSASNINKPTNEKASTNQQIKIGLNNQRFLNINPYITKENNNNTKIEFCDYRSLSNNAFANELKAHKLIKENN